MDPPATSSDSTCIRICPSPTNLSTSSIKSITCADCSKTFQNLGALRLHQIKSHGQVSTASDNRLLRGRNRSIKKESVEKLYFCPIDTCKFNNRQSINYFRTMANLKQHYGKVHEERNLICKFCKEAAFGLEKTLRYHEKRCGSRKLIDRSENADEIDCEKEVIAGDSTEQKETEIDNRSISAVEKISDQSLNDRMEKLDNRPNSNQSNTDRSADQHKIDTKTDPPSIIPSVIILRPVIIVQSGQPSKTNRSAVKSISTPDQKKISLHRSRILPKPICKTTIGTQTGDVSTRESISIGVQCDYSDFTNIWTDRPYNTPVLDLDHLATAAYLTSRFETTCETAACQTSYVSPIPPGSSNIRCDTAAVQSESVAYNDFFCQTYMPHMADASVSTDFRVSTVTSGQQCQLLYPSSTDLMTPPPPYDDHQTAQGHETDDSNLAWTNNETQTDIAMMEFDDLFSYVGWQDMETQT